MMTKRIFGAAITMGLVALSAVSVEAAQLRDSGDKVTSDIVVVNDYSTSVRVYVEDSEGSVYRLGRVGRGKVGQFETPADVLECRMGLIHPMLRFTQRSAKLVRDTTASRQQTSVFANFSVGCNRDCRPRNRVDSRPLDN